MRRREFIKLMGMASSATLATSCGVEKGTQKLIPYLVPPEEDIVPGEAIFKSTTCSECPANCGVTAKIHDKVLEMRHRWVPTKLEGNPAHPLSRGALCVRGQASLTRLYHEKRIRSPRFREARGNYRPLSWEQVYYQLLKAYQMAREQKKQNVYLAGRTTGTLSRLIDGFCDQLKIQRLPEFEVFSHASVRKANQTLFNRNDIPDYNIESCGFLLTLGADIVETFVQPVAFAKQVSRARERNEFHWAHVQPHVSLTGFHADERMTIYPESEPYLLAFLIQALEDSARKKPPRRVIRMIPKFSLNEVATKTGIDPERIQNIVERLKKAQNPLLIVGGMTAASASGYLSALLGGLLQWMMGMIGVTIDFARSYGYERVGTLQDMKHLSRRLENGEIGVIFISRCDPVRFLPPDFKFAEHLDNAVLSVALSDTLNETMAGCDLIIPLSHSLESWGDAEPRKGLTTLIQPVLEPLFNTILEGDLLLEMILKEVGATEAANFQEFLFQTWRRKFGARALDEFQKTGFHEQKVTVRAIRFNEKRTRSALAGQRFPEGARANILLLTPSLRTYEGRSRDLPLLRETPDPLTSISYGEWLSISEQDARQIGVLDEDHLKISDERFSFELPVKIQPGLNPGIFQVQRDFLPHFPSSLASDSGEFTAVVRGIQVEKTGRTTPLPILSGALLHKGRKLRTAPEMREKRREQRPQMYKEPEHPVYRWAMAIDLEKCTGCSACVAACYIENNVPLVGKDEHLRGREMSWIRIDPRYTRDGASFHPIMCQHCSNAPCEPVCPVYAAYHNPEGLNAQIYNRCVGTRYCSNNCPYKVRRFNWFEHTKPALLHLMDNPEVSVRWRGVMEKCSLCVQRIRAAKDHAKDEGRLVREGDFTTACAQTCPTDAIVFGNLLDPADRVAQLAASGRAFHELEELNTLPGITYLRKKNA